MFKGFGMLVLLVSGLSSGAKSQVQVVVPARQYMPFERIPAKVVNSGDRPITYCVEYGQTSPKAIGDSESTPIPFCVQWKPNGKWGTLLIGPDVGSARITEVLPARQSHEYPFRLMATGQMRLVLEYLPVDDPTVRCSGPLEHPRTVKSDVFTIRQDPPGKRHLAEP